MTAPTPPDQVARICELYQGGYGVRQTAGLVGVGTSTVHRILVREKIPTRPTGVSSPHTQAHDQQEPEMISNVCALYQSGNSMRTIARLAGTTKYRVETILLRQRVKIRPQRFAPGPGNPRWGGDQVGYSAFHNRVWRARGMPQHCTRCEASGPGREYQWANLTGNYADIWDYARMCRTCHNRYDAARRAEQ